MLVAGLLLVIVFVLMAALAPWIAPYNYNAISGPGGDFGSRMAPSAAHPFGTTIAGYDVLSRVVWGSRTAFLVIVIAVAASIFIGSLLGLANAKLDQAGSRTSTATPPPPKHDK